MSTKYKFHDQYLLYFVSFSVVNWIDLFTRKEYKDIMIASWKHCQQYKGLEIYGYCIMTNHIHMIIGTHIKGLTDEQLIQSVRAPITGEFVQINTKTGNVVQGNTRVYELQRRGLNIDIPVKTYTPDDSAFPDLKEPPKKQ